MHPYIYNLYCACPVHCTVVLKSKKVVANAIIIMIDIINIIFLFCFASCFILGDL